MSLQACVRGVGSLLWIIMKFITKIWFRLAAFVFAILLSPCAVTEGLPDVIDGLRASIVGIGTVRPARGAKRPPVNFLGTGFVVGNGNQIITNYHVIPESLNSEQKEVLAVFVGRGQDGKALPARILRTDPGHDLALLEVGGKPMTPVRLGTADFIREGSDIAFTGFPMGMILGLYPVTHRGIISAITPVVIPAISVRDLTAEKLKRIRNPFDVYQLDATAYPGNSGSPIYLRDSGLVVGVINSVFIKDTKETILEKPSGISYAIPIKYVHKLLNSK